MRRAERSGSSELQMSLATTSERPSQMVPLGRSIRLESWPERAAARRRRQLQEAPTRPAQEMARRFPTGCRATVEDGSAARLGQCTGRSLLSVLAVGVGRAANAMQIEPTVLSSDARAAP